LPSTTGIHYRSNVLLIPGNNVDTNPVNTPTFSSQPVFDSPMQVPLRTNHEITPIAASLESVSCTGLQLPIAPSPVVPGATPGMHPTTYAPGATQLAPTVSTPATTGVPSGRPVSPGRNSAIGASSPAATSSRSPSALAPGIDTVLTGPWPSPSTSTLGLASVSKPCASQPPAPGVSPLGLVPRSFVPPSTGAHPGVVPPLLSQTCL
jgi:hypothetical protein